ncbi:MAG TPA: hypothetical protein VI756_24980 [Blastocatellia bacterium]
MSEDERRHLMDFLLQQQAVFHSEMVDLKNAADKTSENLDRLVAKLDRLAEEAEIDRQAMRAAINNLIIGNEATRELANQVAQLALLTSADD